MLNHNEEQEQRVLMRDVEKWVKLYFKVRLEEKEKKNYYGLLADGKYKIKGMLCSARFSQ